MAAMSGTNSWQAADEADRPAAVIELGNLRIDPRSSEVSVDSRPVDLTHQEFELLLALAEEAGRVRSYASLGRALWQAEGAKALRRLNVATCRLRAKLAGSRPYRIETVRRRGYGLLARPAGQAP
jgi:DNA-binding response OmpR family regulator